MIKDPHLKIKKVRELRDYSQQYMGDELIIGTRAYSKIETGETQLTIKRVNQISEILKIDALELLAFDHQQIFNKAESASNINVSYPQLYDKLIAQYEKHIKSLEDQILLLKAQIVNDALL